MPVGGCLWRIYDTETLMVNRFIWLVSFSFIGSTLFAQSDYRYSQKVSPVGIDNYQFSSYYYNGKKTYNLRGSEMSNGYRVCDMRINPSGSSFALIDTKKEKKYHVRVYDLWSPNTVIKILDTPKMTPKSLVYSPDSRLLAISYLEGDVLIYNTSDYKIRKKLYIPLPASKMAFSGNNNFLATAIGDSVQIWNLETGLKRETLQFTSNVNDVCFTSDNTKLLVLTAAGNLSLYDATTFSKTGVIDTLGDGLACSIHNEGKYVAVLTSPSRITIVNLLDWQDRQSFDVSESKISGIRFVTDRKKNSYVLYGTPSSITYKYISQIVPYYGKMMRVELEEKMNQWMKQMPGETLEEYELRVNDKTRIEQIKLFEREISTRMAGEILSKTEITIGGYNIDRGKLALNFSTMPTIVLDVPNEELSAFADAGKLEFRNVSYALTTDDKFEIVYAEVYNPVNKKTYIYNNLDHAPSVKLNGVSDFVPMRIVQLSNMEEIKLQDIRENIMEKAVNEKRISDKTNINVTADALMDYDASGRRIINYKIGFAYTVEKGYSEREDFGAGKYHTEESGAASSLLAIIKTAFDSEFSQYVKAGKKLKVKIRGTADATPIRGTIPYDEKYGEYQMEPVYKNEELTNLTLTKAKGITNNDQLAFARALGVRNHISENIEALSQMDTEYDYYIEVANESGSQYRRISIDFIFIDAFKQ